MSQLQLRPALLELFHRLDVCILRKISIIISFLSAGDAKYPLKLSIVSVSFARSRPTRQDINLKDVELGAI